MNLDPLTREREISHLAEGLFVISKAGPNPLDAAGAFERAEQFIDYREMREKKVRREAEAAERGGK